MIVITMMEKIKK